MCSCPIFLASYHIISSAPDAPLHIYPVTGDGVPSPFLLQGNASTVSQGHCRRDFPAFSSHSLGSMMPLRGAGTETLIQSPDSTTLQPVPGMTFIWKPHPSKAPVLQKPHTSIASAAPKPTMTLLYPEDSHRLSGSPPLGSPCQCIPITCSLLALPRLSPARPALADQLPRDQSCELLCCPRKDKGTVNRKRRIILKV